jgi:hypothetical protein
MIEIVVNFFKKLSIFSIIFAAGATSRYGSAKIMRLLAAPALRIAAQTYPLHLKVKANINMAKSF